MAGKEGMDKKRCIRREKGQNHGGQGGTEEERKQK